MHALVFLFPISTLGTVLSDTYPRMQNNSRSRTVLHDSSRMKFRTGRVTFCWHFCPLLTVESVSNKGCYVVCVLTISHPLVHPFVHPSIHPFSASYLVQVAMATC